MEPRPPNRHETIVHLNAEPLNAAAGALLPADWLGDVSLNMLSLALWGTENGVRLELPGGRITDEAVLDELLHLHDADPTRVMALFDGESAGDDQLVSPNALDGLDRETAARYVLEAIRDLLTDALDCGARTWAMNLTADCSKVDQALVATVTPFTLGAHNGREGADRNRRSHYRHTCHHGAVPIRLAM